MRKFFILFLVVLPCLASEPKFHYMDCVKVAKGFYKGCKGKVVSYIARFCTINGQGTDPNSYSVDVEDCRGGNFVQDFNEDELRGCKK